MKKNTNLIDIARCEHFLQYQTNRPCPKGCKRIIESQFKLNIPPERLPQIPEPWSGDIVNAKVLFIGSNPSIGDEDKYPTLSWNNEEITDFFENRFSKHAFNEIRPLKENGDPVKNWVRYYAGVRKRAQELFINRKNIELGKDYALTEIVHCKSRREEGVDDVLELCSSLYFDKILNYSQAKIVVILGKKAEFWVRKKIFNGVKGTTLLDNQSKKWFIFLPHPNARIERNSKLLQKDMNIELLTVLKNL